MAEVRKRKSRRRVPWGQILGEPIERVTALSMVDGLFEQEEKRDKYRRQIEKMSLAVQFRKMCLVKQHYGIEGEAGWRPWYQLALAIASEFYDGLKIIDPPPTPTGKTAPRWRGAEGLELLRYVEILKQDAGSGASVYSILAELRGLAPHRYGRMSLDALEANYHVAKKHHLKSKDSGTKKRSHKKRSAS